MRALALLVVFLMVSVSCFAAAIDNCVDGSRVRVTTSAESGSWIYANTNSAESVTSNSVTFGTVAMIVTFNSTVNHILLVNEDTTNTVHVTFNPDTELDVRTQDNSSKGAFKLKPSSSVSLDLNLDKIGYISGGNEGTLNYLATSDSSTQP